MNIGDWVRVKLPHLIEDRVGEIGKIIDFDDGYSGRIACISFPDYNPKRHDCGGRTAKGHGWNLPLVDIEVVQEYNAEPASKETEW